MERTIDINRENIVSLCPVELSHTDFLLKLFKECRPDLALIDGINENQKEAIIFQQFTIEQEQLSKVYPDAEFNIVMLNEESIGRLYVYHGKTSDHIIEIALLEKYRALGIGKKLMNKVIENAVGNGKNISLQVAWFNQGAYTFYKKLGFNTIKNNGVFCEMRYMI